MLSLALLFSASFQLSYTFKFFRQALILITLELANSGDVKVSSMTLEFNSAILLINEPRLQGAWQLRRDRVYCQSWLLT